MTHGGDYHAGSPGTVGVAEDVLVRDAEGDLQGAVGVDVTEGDDGAEVIVGVVAAAEQGLGEQGID